MLKTSGQTGRARRFWVLAALWATLGSTAALVGYAAQVRRNGALPTRRRAQIAGQGPIIGPQFPAVDLRRIDPNAPNAVGAMTGGPGGIHVMGPGGAQPSNAPPPYFDLTTFNKVTRLRQPNPGDSTASHELHPFYSPDQQSIFIDSDRIDVNGEFLPPAGASFHIWQITPDGSGVAKITGVDATGPRADEASGNQIFPAVNNAFTKLAFIHRPAAPGSNFELYLLDLTRVPPVRTQLTGGATQPAALRNLINVGRPSWSEGGNLIAFAAQELTNNSFNIYTLDPLTLILRNITQLPNGSGIECVDAAFRRLPASTTDRVTFASTAKAVNGATGFFLAGSGTPGSHAIWQADPVNPATAGAPFQRLTFGANSIDDRQPAWNRGNGTSRFFGFMAFASKGRTTGQRGVATYNINWYTTAQLGNPAGPTPHALLVPDNDPQVPTALQDLTDETAPTWTLGLSGIERIAHHSNRLKSVDPNCDLQPSPNSVCPPPEPMAILQYPYPGEPGTGGNRDIWTSDAQDINPPTMLPFNEQTGEIVRIVDDAGRKNGAAGSTFHFFVRAKDIGSGIANGSDGATPSVWIQIKDPDSASQDSQGQEHKLYGVNNSTLGSANDGRFIGRVNGTPQVTGTLIQNVEFDCEGVSASNYSFYRAPQRNDVFQYARYNTIRCQVPSYLPGVDDAVAFSGQSFPPLLGQWLELKPLAGQADVFTADWVTPTNPSDFYVDVIIYDKAQDPLNAANVGNWIIFDNVGGFSTQPLIERSPCLAVMDYALGQKWLRGNRGAFRAFAGFRLGTESEVMDRSRAFDVLQNVFAPSSCNPNPTGPGGFDLPILDPTVRVNGLAPAGSLSFIGGPEQTQHFFPILGTDTRLIRTCVSPAAWPHYGADIWRILAKGPVPPEVLADYLPSVERQPNNIDDANLSRNQLVPKRMVLWHAPFTGDVWAGAGTILDQNMQANLKQFTDLGGRLLVDGGDVAWALSQDGVNPTQPFLQNVLGAAYTGDSVGGETTGVNGGSALATELNTDLGQYANQPVNPPCPFGYAENFPDTLITPFAFPPNNQANYSGNLNDAVPSNGSSTTAGILDGIAPLGVGETIFPSRMIAREDPVNKGLYRAKVLYMGFGIHSMARRQEADGDPGCADSTPPYPNPNLIQLNYKEKWGHSIVCWMLSATLVGQIKDISDQPVSGAFVEAVDGNGNRLGTALARGDGFYIINGLPHGSWGVSAQAPGFISFFKASGAGGHALEEPRLDIRLTPAEPGSISGQVTDSASGAGIPGAKIHAKLRASPLFVGQVDFFAFTDSNGQYKIDRATTGLYDVFVDTPFPTGFGNPQPPSRTVQVNSAQDTGGVNFTMDGLPGPLDVTVTEVDANGQKIGPLPNADVALFQNGQPLPGFSGKTDAQGKIHFDNVPPGPTDATAKLDPDYPPKTVSFSMPQTTSIEILLQKDTRPKGDVYGTVRFKKTGQALTASAFPNLLVHIQQGGKDVLPATTMTDPLPSPVFHNYMFSTVRNDTYDFTVNDARFLPATTTKTTNANPPAQPFTAGVDILLDGQPGKLQGFVKDAATFAAIPNATVTVLRADTGTVAASMLTNSAGFYQTPSNLSSDQYIVRATAFAYQPGQLPAPVLVAGPTTAPDLLLSREPPVRVSGTIRAAIDGSLVAGALVELFLPDGTFVEAADGLSDPFESGNPPHNYIFSSVPVGATYVVKVSRSGFRSAQQTITVSPGVPRDRVDFSLQAAFTFLSGLQLVSLPDDYTTPQIQDPRAVFGPNFVNMAKFLPTINDYLLYRQGPPAGVPPGYGADRLAAGYGEFVRFSATTAFTTAGNKTPSGPFGVPILPGWTIIGNPRSEIRIEFMKIGVLRANGVLLTMQQAFDQGLILPNLFGWTGSTYTQGEQFLEPFRGYYIKNQTASEVLTLVMPDPAMAAANGPMRLASMPLLLQPPAQIDRAALLRAIDDRLMHGRRSLLPAVGAALWPWRPAAWGGRMPMTMVAGRPGGWPPGAGLAWRGAT
jgi:hypothetical protein